MMTKLVTMTIMSLLAAGAHAQAVYKCTENGKVSYADQPCAGGRATALPAVPAVDTAAAQARAKRDGASLAAIEKEHARRLASEEKAEREHARAATRADTQRQKCERLRLKQRWAEEDAARAAGKAKEAARLKAKRQGEALAVECPA